VATAILSIISPAARYVLWGPRASFVRAFRAVARLIQRAYVVMLVPPLRPIVGAVLAEAETFPRPKGLWMSHENKYFPNVQRADLKALDAPSNPPVRISCSCSCNDPYWRAGVILAGRDYDPTRNRIAEGILIHIGADSPGGRPTLNVYVAEKKIVDQAFPTASASYRVSIYVAQEQIIVKINDLVPTTTLNPDKRQWWQQVYLAAWADQYDCSVTFEDIQVS
jgi:hypothetical protein